MTEIQVLIPKHPSFLDYEEVETFAKMYNGNIEDTSHKLYQLKCLYQLQQLVSEVFSPKAHQIVSVQYNV
jgi:hypothetical protein